MRRLLSACLLLLPIVTCLEPTQVRVTIRTDICEKLDVAISTGDNPPITQVPFPRPSKCEARRLGDIVFVPSSGPKRFTFHVRAAAEGGDCQARVRCVTASRNVGYLPHTALDLTVELTSDCIGVDCPAGRTCVRGACVDDFVDCMDKTCADGGLVDAGVADTRATDAPTDASTCKPPQLALLVNNPTPRFYWSFESVNGTIKENLTNTPVPLDPKNTTSANNGVAGCGEALSIANPQSLVVKHPTPGIAVSMYVYVPAGSTAVTFLKKNTGNGLQGIALFSDFKRVFQVQTCGPSSCSYLEFPALPVDAWTAIEVTVRSTGVIGVSYDGAAQQAQMGFVHPMPYGGGTLSLGEAGNKGFIDELRVYDLQ